MTVVDTHTLGSDVDKGINVLTSPTPLTVSSVGVERDGFRNGNRTRPIPITSSNRWAGGHPRDVCASQRQ